MSDPEIQFFVSEDAKLVLQEVIGRYLQDELRDKICSEFSWELHRAKVDAVLKMAEKVNRNG